MNNDRFEELKACLWNSDCVALGAKKLQGEEGGDTGAFGSKREKVKKVNIEIGTGWHGTTDGLLKPGETLISFDPFDKYHESEGHLSFPFIVANLDGPVNFTVNHQGPGCSSLNQLNPEGKYAKINESLCENLTHTGFGDVPLLIGAFKACVDTSRLEVKVLDGIRLSTFLRKYEISRVGTLKIDAQGSDLSILKDVLENSPEVMGALVLQLLVKLAGTENRLFFAVHALAVNFWF